MLPELRWRQSLGNALVDPLVAISAKGRQVVQFGPDVIGVHVAVDDVVSLQPVGPAATSTPHSIAFEAHCPGESPFAGIQIFAVVHWSILYR